MLKPLLLNLSSEVDDIAGQLCQLERASPEEIALLTPQIEAFTESELIRFAENVIDFTKDENLLSMVYESPAVISRIGFSTVTKLYGQLYSLHQASMISPDGYQRLAASLISHYPNKRNLNLLKELQPIIASDDYGRIMPLHNPGAAFDEAMAKHVMDAPCRSTEELFKSWDSLRVVELPKSLEVFVRQMLADSEAEQVSNLVVEFFQQYRLPDSYIDVFRRVLGDDVFFGLCAKANEGSGACLAAAAKIVPLAGEEIFHGPEFLAGIKSQIDGPNPSSYLRKFADFNCDESVFPILASFVLSNLPLVLKDSLTLLRLGSTMPVVRFAHRQGLGDQVLECAIESARVKICKGLQEDPHGMSLAELVKGLTQSLFDPNPDAQLQAMYERLQDIVEVVGLETVKRVIPDVDYRFIQYFMDTRKTELGPHQMMRMFPQIRGAILEDELGL
jgi:hypothetical protein